MIWCFFLVFLSVKCDFIWGASTAAYQIEGGVDSRGKNIWDIFSHIEGKTYKGETGDIADQSYTMYEEDLDLLKELGVSHYRFSISWSRIFPTDNFSSPDPVGVKYYNNVINGLIKRNIQPLVTLYHWDAPIYADWLDSKVVSFFGEYARECFKLFGDRVPYWLTLNEPLSFVLGGYDSGNAAPGRCSDRKICDKGDSSTEPYIVAKNALLSHATAYKIYKDEFAKTYGGEVGITLNLDNVLPLTDSQEDILAAQRGNEFRIAWFADPIYFGHYPASMIKYVGDRLPTFTEEEASLLKGSSDFFGLNHYTTVYGSNPKEEEEGEETITDYFTDSHCTTSYTSANGTLIGPQAASDWLHVYPEGFRQTLNYVKNRYNNPRIMVTENGVDAPGEDVKPLKEILNDTFRQDFLRNYLNEMLKAKKEDGVNVIGYFCWSILDNYEWADGYSKKFGLVYVDRENDLKRIKKDSFNFYKEYIKNVSI